MTFVAALAIFVRFMSQCLPRGWSFSLGPSRALAANSETALGSHSDNDFVPGGILVPVEQKPWWHQEHYLLKRDKTTVGRASHCDVRINHPMVSRIHLELSWAAGTLMIAHMSPANPTLVNGLPVTEPRPLRTGDRIEIAEGVEFRVELFGGGDDDTPTEPRRQVERRMYAILHADVVSYSRLIEDDDFATARQFEARLELIRNESARLGGRIENLAGDAILIFFTSALSAVNSAICWQRGIKLLNQQLEPHRHMEFRVGINSGDVLVTPAGGLYGDAVNIATRIQTLAPPGGILVAGVVRDQLQGRGDFKFEYAGTNELKNVSREVRVYRLEF